MAGMLYLTNVLQLIINSLDQRSFPKHNLVILKREFDVRKGAKRGESQK